MTVPAIAIIGGGPCGLTLENLLERKGIAYAVYERDESPSSNHEGGSLDLHASTGQLALRECGLFEEFKRRARYDDTVFSIADKSGNEILEVGQGRDAPEIDRSKLRQLLLGAIPKEKSLWGHKLSNVELGEDSRPILQFTNGALLSGFKLVVGADGAWSKVRCLVNMSTPRYTGKSYVVSKTEPGSPLYETAATKVAAGSSLTIGSGKFVMIQRQGNGSYRNSFGLQVPENFFRNGTVDLKDVEATRHLLLSEYFADWSDENKDLIRHSTDFRAWPLYTLTTEDMNWKTVSGVTVAGDAAHLAYPGGEGVNLAMIDALRLASSIVEHGVENMDEAVHGYERDMFPRAIAAIGESQAMASVMYSEDPQALIQLICS